MSFDREIATEFVDPRRPLLAGIPAAPPAGTRYFRLPAVTKDWVIREAPNGGWLLCVILDGVMRDLQMGDPDLEAEYGLVLPEGDSRRRFPDPIECSATYLNVSKMSLPAYVEVKRLRVGGKMATVDATLWQDQRTAAKPDVPHPVLVVKATVTFGDLTKETGPSHTTDGDFPRIAPLEDCRKTPSLSNPGRFGKPDNPIKARKVIDYLEVYSDPRTQSENWQRTERLDWARFRDRDQKLTSLSLGFWCDSYLPPPVGLGYMPGEYWFPTMHYAVFWKRRPRPDTQWLVTRGLSRWIINGRFDNASEVWDADTKEILAISLQTQQVSSAAKQTRGAVTAAGKVPKL
ncbi:thioesterase-like superfamily-domain-containing protein [Hyaloraphidium curvatum]|nr:thioesterase-like superfamily-domain-containing protein [Hyaloraphidium curvatum]